MPEWKSLFVVAEAECNHERDIDTRLRCIYSRVLYVGSESSLSLERSGEAFPAKYRTLALLPYKSAIRFLIAFLLRVWVFHVGKLVVLLIVSTFS